MLRFGRKEPELWVEQESFTEEWNLTELKNKIDGGHGCLFMNLLQECKNILNY
jgi:hypothetical protein